MAYGVGGFQQAQPSAGGMFMVPITNEQQVNTYLVGAGQTVCLADFGGGMMWMKTTAANGIPQPVRKFRMEEIIEQPQVTEGNVSRQEFDELKEMLSQLLQQNQGQAVKAAKGGAAK